MSLGWCEAATIGPGWFFHRDYGWPVLKAMCYLFILCITVIFALLHSFRLARSDFLNTSQLYLSKDLCIGSGPPKQTTLSSPQRL